MSTSANIAAIPHLPSPDMAAAIGRAVELWYATYNNGAADFNHTLLSLARALADLITEMPDVSVQAQAFELFAAVCAANCTAHSVAKYGPDRAGAPMAHFH